jgi:hypothetical protein
MVAVATVAVETYTKVTRMKSASSVGHLAVGNHQPMETKTTTVMSVLMM